MRGSTEEPAGGMSRGGRLVARLTGTAGVGQFRTYRARLAVQIFFALLCMVLGIRFARFLGAAREGTIPLPVRPPGVEGFLPISGLMGLVDWIYQGTLNVIHPAATILFLLFTAIALILRKSFCSWICPVGLLSEMFARVGQKLFGRNRRLPIWLDVPLRGLKYLLLGFFLWAILTMSAAELRGFINSPYNRISDVKMYLFFARLGTTAAIVLVVLALASVPLHGAWCRYLCPYGALLGLFSWASPVKVRRDEETCIDCNICDKVCMARLPVSRKEKITSVECTGCLDCVAACPVEPALTVGTKRRRFGPVAFALVLLLIYVGGYLTARSAGLWRNGIGDAEYVERIEQIDRSIYAHPDAGGLQSIE